MCDLRVEETRPREVGRRQRPVPKPTTRCWVWWCFEWKERQRRASKHNDGEDFGREGFWDVEAPGTTGTCTLLPGPSYATHLTPLHRLGEGQYYFRAVLLGRKIHGPGMPRSESHANSPVECRAPKPLLPAKLEATRF